MVVSSKTNALLKLVRCEMIKARGVVNLPSDIEGIRGIVTVLIIHHIGTDLALIFFKGKGSKWQCFCSGYNKNECQKLISLVAHPRCFQDRMD